MNTLPTTIERSPASVEVLRQATAAQDPKVVSIDETRLQALDLPRAALAPALPGLSGTPMGSSLGNAITYLVLLNAIHYRFWHAPVSGLARNELDEVPDAPTVRQAFAAAWGQRTDPQGLIRVATTDNFRLHFGDLAEHERHERFSELLGKWHSELQRSTHDASIFQVLLEDEGLKLQRFAQVVADQIEMSGDLTTQTAQVLAQAFPSIYADPLLAKAQLAIGEIAGYCHEAGIPMREQLTGIADYATLRVLRRLGVLKVAAKWARRLDKPDFLPQDDAVERALRGAVVLACERLATRYGVEGFRISHYLWTHRNTIA